MQNTFPLPRFTNDQETKGYWIEGCKDRVPVWHNNTQIALLCPSPDINRKVQDVIENRRKQLEEVEQKLAGGQTRQTVISRRF